MNRWEHGHVKNMSLRIQKRSLGKLEMTKPILFITICYCMSDGADTHDSKLLALLDVVIDHYITKGDPIGSKFLHSVQGMDYAPSTLRKYLNLLEKSGLVYQPYNSSGRIPTIQGLTAYIEQCLHDDHPEDAVDLELEMTRGNLRQITERLGGIVDGVVVGFIPNDEYYFLGINNLLREHLADYDSVRAIVDFIEKKEIIEVLAKNIVRRGHVYYTFTQDEDETIISCLYTKISVNGYDCMICIVGPARVNYRKNLAILKKLVELIA